MNTSPGFTVTTLPLLLNNIRRQRREHRKWSINGQYDLAHSPKTRQIVIM